MPTYEVFSYWNIHELQLVFNAVAAIVGGGDYLGLLRTLAIVGLISMAMAVLAGFAQLPDMGRWIIMLAVFNAILLVPKVTVVLTDETGSQGQVTVANVPLGLAAFAHEVSHVGNWLTQTYETTFSLPTDLQFRTNGTLWGHRVQQEMLHTKFNNSILTSNLLEFYRECVIPEFATGYIVMSDMTQQNDIWTYLNGRTNPGRLVTLAAVPGATTVVAGTYGCDVAYTKLTAQMLYVTTQQMNTLGNRLYPGLPTAAANAAIQSSIQTSTNYMLGISMNAMDIVKQTAMSNFMIDAQYMLPAQIGDAASASANLAQAQAIRSTSESYKMMAKLAESTMPKVKNIVEIVQYSVFPIVLLMIMLAGHKGGLVFKAYVMSLVWVQLWPPLYAVMHMIMTLHAQELATMTSGMGLSMSQYSLVNNAYISDEAIAGMIAATAIPAIAAALVKGGDVGAQAIMGMSSPSREAEKVAAGVATGNMQMGNASLGNQSADNLSMGQVNTRPTLTQGGMQVTGADNVGHFYGSGGEVINNANAFQNIGTKIGLSGKVSGAAQTASENAESTAFQESVAAKETLSSVFGQASSFEKGHGRSLASSSQDLTGSQASFLQSYTDATKIAHQYATENGLSQKQEAELVAEAGAQASGGVNIMGSGATVSAGTSVKGKSASSSSQVQKVAQQLAQDKGFSNAITTMRNAAHQESFTQGNEQTRRAAEGIRNGLDQARAHESAASASHNKSLAFKEVATRTREQGANFDTNHMNQFMDWMSGQKNHTSGKNFTASDVEFMSRYSPEHIGEYAQKFTDEKLVPEVEKNLPAPTNGVAGQYEANKAQVPGEGAVTNFHNQGKAPVTGAANAAGVNPNTAPVNNVAPQVQAMTGHAKGEIAAGAGGINKEGDPLKTGTTKATDPTNTNNLGNALANAATVGVSSDAIKLADRAGMIPEHASLAKPVADSNHESLTHNLVGTAVDVGLLALGGAGGRFGGVAAEKLAENAGKLAGEKVIANEAQAEVLATTRYAQSAATQVAQKVEGVEAATGKAVADAAEKTAATDAAKAKSVADKASKADVKESDKVAATLKVGGMIAGVAAGSQAEKVFGVQLPDASTSPQQAVNVVEEKIRQVDKFGERIVKDAVDALKPEDKL